eukprot:TRINITY_DN33223_c0_g1_i1.p1 TRINITY_DN33223_c0_g1~~TRINITY_DN33223_c0_g1_i1.p1  ORF type:complete len:187 (-),score=31.36 TRINITY_DN33223_c0_g1_i1:7-495(-)
MGQSCTVTLSEKMQALSAGSGSVPTAEEEANRIEMVKKLHEACRSGNPDDVRACLIQGAPVDGKDRDGWQGLHYSASAGSVETCKLLLEFHADCNAVLPDLSTSLMLAADEAQIDVARLLLQNGALSKCKDEDGFTAAQRCDASVREEFERLISSAGTEPAG